MLSQFLPEDSLHFWEESVLKQSSSNQVCWRLPNAKLLNCLEHQTSKVFLYIYFFLWRTQTAITDHCYFYQRLKWYWYNTSKKICPSVINNRHFNAKAFQADTNKPLTLKTLALHTQSDANDFNLKWLTPTCKIPWISYFQRSLIKVKIESSIIAYIVTRHVGTHAPRVFSIWLFSKAISAAIAQCQANCLRSRMHFKSWEHAVTKYRLYCLQYMTA